MLLVKVVGPIHMLLMKALDHRQKDSLSSLYNGVHQNQDFTQEFGSKTSL